MNNTGNIKRSKPTSNFTTIPNAILENKTISLKAKGLLIYILRLPPDWIINKTELHKGLKEGRDSVLSAFDELILAGYIHVERLRSAGQFDGFNYEVFDTPISEKPFTEKPFTDFQEMEKPFTENPISDKPFTGKPSLLNTNNTKDLKDKINSKELPDDKKNKQEILEVFNSEKESVNQDPPKREATYTQFVEVYFEWFKATQGIPPDMNGKQGLHMKSIIAYLKNVAKETLIKESSINLNDEIIEDRAIQNWKFILSKWETLEPFYQDKTRLQDIYSNLQNIITFIRNGSSKDRQQKQIINQKGTDQAGRIITNLFSKHNAGDRS